MVNTFNDAMRRRFGCKVYRLSLDGGMTCPNRDGTVGTRGCVFCDGSGYFAAAKTGDIAAQFEEAKLRVAGKAQEAGYVAYFQSYTNTYAPLSVLERLFTEATAQSGVLALSVATRPDCLPEDTLALLESLSRRVPVWVELGLQTVHEKTAVYIRRGYPLSVYEDAVRRLRARRIEVITHMILGLPGETDGMILETARYIGRSGSDGVKFHLLHVLSGTDLAADYEDGLFEPLTMEHYIRLLEECVRLIPPEMVVHRLTGDGAKARLIAPLWSADKKRVLNAIHAAFVRDKVVQGEHYSHHQQE